MSIPDKITRQQVLAALDALGLEPEDVFELTLEPHTVTVVSPIRDDNGGFNKPAGYYRYPRITRSYDTREETRP